MIGVSANDVLSPTPPVLCLSTFTPGMEEIEHIPAVTHGKCQVDRFPFTHSLKTDRHRHGRHLIIRNRTVRKTIDHKTDLICGQFHAKFFFSIRSYILMCIILPCIDINKNSGIKTG